jgi:hypothetical protein
VYNSKEKSEKKGKHSNYKKENIPIIKRKILQIEKGNIFQLEK